jgi:predicted HTH transcriptional regulator
MNNPNKRNPAFTPFTGTVDDLLKNMDKVDVDQVERVVIKQNENYILTDPEAIAMIMAEANVSNEEATDILNEIKHEEITRVCANLVEQGLIEVASYDEDGNPSYSLTDNGKVLAENLGARKK